jgi:hypothetical protein
MHDREVVTIDGDKVGHVVDENDDYLLIEHGLRHHKHAIPRTFVEDGGGELRTTLSKQLVHDSPHVDDLAAQRQEIAEHYGLAEGYTDPPTRGLGDLEPDDPAFGADDNVAARAAIRDAGSQNVDDPDELHSPGLLGGNRFRDAPRS